MHFRIAAACLLAACTTEPAMTCLECPVTEDIPIACGLDAMSPEERAREGVLIREHRTSFVERVEHDDGYAYRYPADPALFTRMAELASLEHRCCPFLTFSLSWGTGDAAPWLRIGGGARVKPFVSEAFGEPR